MKPDKYAFCTSSSAVNLKKKVTSKTSTVFPAILAAVFMNMEHPT